MYNKGIKVKKIWSHIFEDTIKNSMLSNFVCDIEVDSRSYIYSWFKKANIKVFDDSCKFQYVIEKRVNGLDEFSDGICKMHFINDSVLIVFDDLLRRLSYFDKMTII